MAASAKVLALTTGLALLAGPTCAQQAQPAAADRCEGTLCDLYYSSRGNAPTAATPATAPKTAGVPAGATPLMAPTSGNVFNWFGGSSSSPASGTGPASASRPAAPASEEASYGNSYMHLGTNGVLGDHTERCSGTLCDTFYGSSPSEPAAAGQQAAAMAPTTGREPVVPHRHLVHESETRPKCSSPAADPWHCMR